MRRYGDTLRPKGYPPLLMRVGVNTGEVVVRSIRKDDLHADYVPWVIPPISRRAWKTWRPQDRLSSVPRLTS